MEGCDGAQVRDVGLTALGLAAGFIWLPHGGMRTALKPC